MHICILKSFSEFSRCANEDLLSWHPEADGWSESTNRTVRSYIKHLVFNPQKDWDKKFLKAYFSYSSAISENKRLCPYWLGMSWNAKSLLAFFSGSNATVQIFGVLGKKLKASVEICAVFVQDILRQGNLSFLTSTSNSTTRSIQIFRAKNVNWECI